CFKVTPKTKIDFVKNRLCVKFPVFHYLIFLLFFLALLKTIGNFKF
ncbi:Uncharacterized protein FWK35_00034068, partial [Aphis craccivora]